MSNIAPATISEVRGKTTDSVGVSQRDERNECVDGGLIVNMELSITECD